MVLQVFLKSSRVRTDTFIFSMVYTSQQTISINFRCIMYLESVSCSVISDCLQPHGLQHARLPCPSPTPGAYSDPCPLSRWCHPAISSSVIAQPARLLCPSNSPGKNMEVGSHSLLQRLFLNQESNPGLLHCRWILYHLSHQGNPRLLEWEA